MHAYILQIEFCSKSFSHLRLFVEKEGKKYESSQDIKQESDDNKRAKWPLMAHLSFV